MIKIDKTDPKIKWEYSNMSASHTRYSGRKKVEKKCYTKVTFTAKCSDPYSKKNNVKSGVQKNPARKETPTSLGNHKYSATCTDNAGNSVSATSETYNICKKSVSSNCRYKECAAKACGAKKCTSKRCCGTHSVTVKEPCTKTKEYQTGRLVHPGGSACPKLSNCWITHINHFSDEVQCIYSCKETYKSKCSRTKPEANTCTTGCCGYHSCRTSACGNESCYHN
jgi:hypothetical protein